MKNRRGVMIIDDPQAIERASSLIGCPSSAFTRVVADDAAIMRAWSKRTGKRLSGADARKMRRALKDAGVIVEGATGVRLEVVRAEETEEDT